ncbi:endoplasmic reticulum-derived transport vesicle ERV46 [Suillus decipiens]|nr:endoplasmic reticulum-derived transport vesicle ERV46 [Suillus decipiens]
MAKGFLSGFKGIDAFGKTTEDVKVKTRTGALLTLISTCIILALTTIEFFDYKRVGVDTSIVVDRSRGQKLSVRLNVTFPHVPCYLLSLDVMDISGERQRHVSHNVLKKRITKTGMDIPASREQDLRNEVDKLAEQRANGYCGSCYGGQAPESGCCNTCEEVRQAYINMGWSFGNPDDIKQCVEEGWSEKLKDQADEGCSVSGFIRVNKVVGSIQISPGRSYQTGMQGLVPYLRDDGNPHDFSHQIHEFFFMADDEYNPNKAKLGKDMKLRMGIADNPLDGVEAKTTKAAYMYQYFLKVVSTQFRTLDGKTINAHQYSSTQFERDLTEPNEGENKQGVFTRHGVPGSPGAYFNFEISPILIVHSETRQSFAHFLTSTCAIVGGVLTVAALLDSILFATGRKLKNIGGDGAVKLM